MVTSSTEIHRDLIELSKRGDRKSQHQLYHLYGKAMFNICVRMLNSVVEAEDVLQEAFCDAFGKLDSYRYESTFGAWMKRLVVNHCINHLKKRKIDLVVQDNMALYDNSEDEPEDEDNLKYEVMKIHQAMQQLPEGYRIVFSLFLIEGYDHAEISEVMGITESTSKSQLLRAKQKIREILKVQPQ